MPLIIKEVTISPNTLTIGESFSISANVQDITWGSVKNTFTSWDEVSRSFADWDAVRNWGYSIPDEQVLAHSHTLKRKQGE